MPTLLIEEKHQPAMSRFRLPDAGSIYPEARSFDTDDIRNLCKHLGASQQELDDLDVMLQDVIDGIRTTEQHNASLRTVAAVSSALTLAAMVTGANA